MLLAVHRLLYRRIARWLRPAGRFLATVSNEEWTGEEVEYVGVPVGRVCWSHADETTNLHWIEEAGLRVERAEFVPEGEAGPTLVLERDPSAGGREP